MDLNSHLNLLTAHFFIPFPKATNQQCTVYVHCLQHSRPELVFTSVTFDLLWLHFWLLRTYWEYGWRGSTLTQDWFEKFLLFTSILLVKLICEYSEKQMTFQSLQKCCTKTAFQTRGDIFQRKCGVIAWRSTAGEAGK